MADWLESERSVADGIGKIVIDISILIVTISLQPINDGRLLKKLVLRLCAKLKINLSYSGKLV